MRYTRMRARYCARVWTTFRDGSVASGAKLDRLARLGRTLRRFRSSASRTPARALHAGCVGGRHPGKTRSLGRVVVWADGGTRRAAAENGASYARATAPTHNSTRKGALWDRRAWHRADGGISYCGGHCAARLPRVATNHTTARRTAHDCLKGPSTTSSLRWAA